VTGFQSFLSGVGNGNTTYYTIYEQGTSNWEVGIGSLSGGTTLSRDTIIASSNAGAVVTFGAGLKNVFVDMPSEMIALGGSGQSIQVNQTTESQTYTLATGTNGFAVGPITTASGVTVTIASGQRLVII
jgi:hypothetical protein